MSCRDWMGLPAAACLAALLVGTAAYAESPSRATRTLAVGGWTVPQWGVELRAGPYRPRVGPGVERQYYREFFTEAHEQATFRHGPLQKSLELDWYLHRRFGLLGLMARVGHWTVRGAMRVCRDDAGQYVRCEGEALSESTAGNSRTSLTVVPVTVAAIYRMDLLKRHLGIPLSLHAKGGVDYTFWWIGAKKKRAELGTGKDREPARGGTPGLSAAVGAALNLNWIEPQAAQRGLASNDITDSRVIFEVTRIWGNGFGDSKRLDVSDIVYSLALGVDFR